MITTTLNRIRAYRPCQSGWEKLLRGLGKTRADDEPLPYSTILRINGLNDALWCCRAEPQYAKEWRLYAVWCARRPQHLMTDARSVSALDVAERFALGDATTQELAAAKAAASAAAKAAASAAAKAAASAAAKAAPSAAAWAAANAAVWSAASAAVWSAASAAASAAAWAAASDAASAAAWAAASDAARDEQAAEFLRVVGCETMPNGKAP
ncbi:MAG: hypothetical protein KGL42_08630 [Betaproteobacteria bacterium]|nr:hypothetical protein [Betaproteobacteria bacterium]